MNKKEWQAIEQARELFQLGEQATADEMKQAYRRMCKKYHPDRAEKGEKKRYAEIMCHLTESYDLLMRYIKKYRFPLKPDKDTLYDPEDWWMHRFGDDPLWGRKKR
ncbi:MAG: DnaJ domain-containing protein [Candidatus Electrothrix sp. GW3-4]|uniref:DnaJ domain-containing protein n=1 Tax=Candidatus Electrothrix sp. GW3-4 TaxID=3126740 RepID=UPI0030CC6E95